MNKQLFITFLLVIALAFGVSANFYATASDAHQYACWCSSTEPSTITITNPAAGVEVLENSEELDVYLDTISLYEISVNGSAAQYTSYYPNDIIISDGSPQELTLITNAPCGMTGDFPRVTRIDEQGGPSKELTQTITFLQCDNFAYRIDKKSVNTCPCTTESIEIEVRNTREFIDTITLDVDIPASLTKRVSQSMKSLVLAPGDSASFYVIVESPCLTAGEHNLTFTLSSEKNMQEEKIPFTYVVDACFDYTLGFGEMTDVPGYEAATEAYSMCDGTSTLLPIKVTNDATMVNSYTITAASEIPAYAVVERLVNMSPGQSAVTFVNVSPASSVQGITNVRVRAVDDVSETRQVYDVPIEIIWCSTPGIEIEEGSVGLGESRLQVNLSNNGAEDARYKVSIEGPKFIKAVNAIDDGNETIYVALAEMQVVPGEMKGFYLLVQADENVSEGDYLTTIIVSDKDRVFKETKEIQVMDKEGGFIAFLLGNFWWIILALLLLLLLLLLLSSRSKDSTTRSSETKETKKERERKGLPWWLWLILLLLIILFLVLLIWWFWPHGEITITENATTENTTLIEEPATEENITVEEIVYENCSVEMYKDTMHEINLSSLFVDPDGDNLTFGVVRYPAMTNITIEESRAQFWPSLGYYGLDYIKLSADDGRGGYVEGDVMKVCIRNEAPPKEEKESAIMSFLKEYRWYIILGLLMLVVTIILLSRLESNREQEIVLEPKKKSTAKKKTKKK
ncbi:hypothetical protein H6504_03685 [Candidatus Woesearchaeota archaeon]|nr:hypothetical protein [Candidatus Woesearchaeota archaeon]